MGQGQSGALRHNFAPSVTFSLELVKQISYFPKA